MAKLLFTDFLTYRFRYQIGYGLIIISFIALLIVAGLYVPGGLSGAEVKNFVQTSSMDLQNISTLAIPNLPFYAAQRLSLELFGPTEFAFKLPSLICAFIAGIGAVLLLRRWFRPNIAVLATVIMITTGQFLYVAQSGVASITYIMWSVWLLLTATMITSSPRHKRFWKILFFIVVPLSLYTPLSVYLVLAIASAGLLHPHVRYVVRRMSRIHLLFFILGSIIIAAPLVYLVIKNPTLGATLLGAPDKWPPDVLANGATLLQQYLNFVTPQSGTLIMPILGLGSIALIILGAWQLFKIRYTARSYTLTAWIILLIPVLLINPTFISVTFVPLLLVLASGLSFLLRYWYRLFPKNPYARFVGVVPLTILVGGLVISGLDRYFDGYRYDPETTSSFNHDLELFNDNLRAKSGVVIVVSANEKPFYNAIASYKKNVLGATIPSVIVRTSTPDTGEFAATKAAHTNITGVAAKQIITTDDRFDSDRFYIYKK
ncbi:MAG: conserved rane protein of unknown function [Candidatus Saccharibacteria bacterium]|nr:conserved rane protein of unknown function [Candidatus Saccharibacteria bacterium]